MDMVKVAMGNAFKVCIPVTALGVDGAVVEGFDLGSCTDIVVKVGVGDLEEVAFTIEDNALVLSFDGTEELGTYEVEVTGKLDGEKWRFDASSAIQIVEHSADAGLPDYTILADDWYTIQGAVALLGCVQSDWECEDTSSLAYIKNKPAGGWATEAWVLAQGFVTQAWVAAQGFATQAWITAQGFATQTWITAQGYYQKAVSGIPKTDLDSEVQASLGKADTALQSFTETDPTVPAWAKAANKPSYTAQEVGALPDSTVVPSALSELSEDASHRTVSDTEKASWNGKSDFSGSFSDLTNRPTTIAGYGISDAKIENGVVTLGGNTITPLTSHQDISGKEDKMSIVAGSGTALTAAVNTAYAFASAVGTLAVTLPVPTDTTHVSTIVFWFTTDASPAVTFTSANTVYFHDGYELEASTMYEVNAAYNGSNWIISSIKIATS